LLSVAVAVVEEAVAAQVVWFTQHLLL